MRGRPNAPGDHRAACASTCVLQSGAIPLERALARACREAGARVAKKSAANCKRRETGGRFRAEAAAFLRKLAMARAREVPARWPPPRSGHWPTLCWNCRWQGSMHAAAPSRLRESFWRTRAALITLAACLPPPVSGASRATSAPTDWNTSSRRKGQRGKKKRVRGVANGWRKQPHLCVCRRKPECIGAPMEWYPFRGHAGHRWCSYSTTSGDGPMPPWAELLAGARWEELPAASCVRSCGLCRDPRILARGKSYTKNVTCGTSSAWGRGPRSQSCPPLRHIAPLPWTRCLTTVFQDKTFAAAKFRGKKTISKLDQTLRMAELVGQSYNVMSCAKCMPVNPFPEHPHNQMS